MLFFDFLLSVSGALNCEFMRSVVVDGGRDWRRRASAELYDVLHSSDVVHGVCAQLQTRLDRSVYTSLVEDAAQYR